MNPTTRRKEIFKVLQNEKQPTNATKLADKFNVSRQVIVGDIALLRAEGREIISTPRGYLHNNIDKNNFDHYTGKIVCLHTTEQTEKELQIIVDNGGETIDVEVEHPIYGVIASTLHLRSRHDIQEFLHKMKEQNSNLLASLTDGIHLHTIQCEDKAMFDRIKKELKEAGILFDENQS